MSIANSNILSDKFSPNAVTEKLSYEREGLANRFNLNTYLSSQEREGMSSKFNTNNNTYLNSPVSQKGYKLDLNTN